MSPGSYNQVRGLAILCPVTSQARGYPWEVPLPAGLPVRGVILSDQVRNLDWRSRKARFICRVPADTVSEVLERLYPLIDPDV